MSGTTDHQVIVIGGGQAGLAAGHFLARSGIDFLIIDAEDHVGSQWRRRWNSLRLFTPARHDGLPGIPYPAKPGSFPTRDEFASYLEDYAATQGLPLLSGTRVTRVSRASGCYTVETSEGELSCDALIVATGATTTPHVPDLAERMDRRISQLHSANYRTPNDVVGDKVLVVGYGNSGAEIAMELAAAGRSVNLAGKHTPSIPGPLLAAAGGLWWLVLTRVLSRRTPIGRKVAAGPARGTPLIHLSPGQVRAAGCHEVGRIESVLAGTPVSADGTVLDVDAIVWCTGFRGDFTWIDVSGLTFDPHGYPIAPFGLPTSVDGLAFVGMPFQARLASQLVGGVGEDARDVVAHIIAGFSAKVTPGR